MKQLLNPVKEQTTLLLCLLFIVVSGVGAATQATIMFRLIMCLIVTIVGIIGAVRVHHKMKSGASDLQATAMNWFGSFLLLTIANTVLFSVFGK